MKLVSEKGDLVVKNLGNSVNDTENNADTCEAEDTCYKGNNVLGLKIANDSVNTGYNYAEYEKYKNLNDLRKALEACGNGFGCHWSVLLV